MALSFLTNLNEEEFKHFLKQAISEVLKEQNKQTNQNLPEILDIKQAAAYLNLKVCTLYEKTSLKQIPHFKKGNKLFFVQAELLKWVQDGKVSTLNEIQGRAATYTMKKRRT
jgi:excisionase family DNA binding protein